MTLSRRLPLLLLILVLLSCPGLASSPAVADQDSRWRAIEMERRKVERLKVVINRHLKKIEEGREREASLLDELEDIDWRIAKKQKMVERIEVQLEEQRRILADKEAKLREAERSWKKVRDHLEKRLRAWYLMGEVDLLRIAFSSSSLPELMIFQDAYESMLDYDRALISVYHNSVTELRLARDARRLEEVVLSQLVSRGTEITVELTGLRQSRERLLERVRTERRLNERAVAEMKKAKADLTRTIEKLKQQRTEAAQGFLQRKGRLAPPARGEIIRRFGEKWVRGDRAYRETGIALRVRAGELVRAVYSGEVVFAGYEKGFGNMVIIDHGMRHYTVTARLGEISVREGDTVSTGEVIGIAGDQDGMLEDGLHFEVRKGSKPQDPLEWIDAARVQQGGGDGPH